MLQLNPLYRFLLYSRIPLARAYPLLFQVLMCVLEFEPPTLDTVAQERGDDYSCYKQSFRKVCPLWLSAYSPFLTVASIFLSLIFLSIFRSLIFLSFFSFFLSCSYCMHR